MGLNGAEFQITKKLKEADGGRGRMQLVLPELGANFSFRTTTKSQRLGMR
jgi:hypothetical protein